MHLLRTEHAAADFEHADADLANADREACAKFTCGTRQGSGSGRRRALSLLL